MHKFGARDELGCLNKVVVYVAVFTVGIGIVLILAGFGLHII